MELDEKKVPSNYRNGVNEMLTNHPPPAWQILENPTFMKIITFMLKNEWGRSVSFQTVGQQIVPVMFDNQQYLSMCIMVQYSYYINLNICMPASLLMTSKGYTYVSNSIYFN